MRNGIHSGGAQQPARNSGGSEGHPPPPAMANHPDVPILRDLCINITDTGYHEDVLTLVQRIKPEWPAEEVVSKTFSEGLANTTRCLHLADDTELGDAVIIRIHGDKLGGLVERNREFMAMQIAAAAGCFTQILAVFSNGVAYQHAAGRTLTGSDLVDPKVIKAVTRKLAQLHVLDLDTVALVDLNGNACHFDMREAMEGRLRQMAANVPDEIEDTEKNAIYQEHKISREDLVDSVDEMFKLFQDIGARTCVNHGDFQPKNILYDEKSGNATFVDYELAEVRYKAMDLNTIFVTRPMWELLGIIKPDDPEITSEVRSLWIRGYLERTYELQGKDPKSIPDSMLEKAGLEQKIFSLAAFLTMSVFAMTFAGVPQFPVPMISLLPIMSQKWRNEKDQLSNLKERYLKLQGSCAD